MTTISRVNFRLSAQLTNSGKEDVRSSAIKRIIDWAAGRTQLVNLPAEAYLGEAFSLRDSDSSLEAIPSGTAWALRLTHADQSGPREVKDRTWHVDIGLQTSEDSVLMSCRVSVSSDSQNNPPVSYSVPKIVKELAGSPGLFVDNPMLREPTFVSTSDEAVKLQAFIESEQRKLPVIVVADFSDDQDYLAPPNLDEYARSFSGACYCLGHVVALSIDGQQHFLEQVGKTWSVVRGGVRVYWPSCRFEDSSPYDHRLAIGSLVIRYNSEYGEGHSGFARELQQELIRRNILNVHLRKEAPFFSELAIRKATSEARSVDFDEMEYLKLTLQDTKEQLNETESLLSESLSLESKLKSELQYEKETRHDLQRRIRYLEDALKSRASDIRSSQAVPATYDEMIERCEEEYVGKIFLHNNAKKGLRKARYKSIETVWQCLDILANEYYRFAAGEGGAKEAFDSRCQEMHLKYDRSVSPSKVGQYGESYYVTYPPQSGKRKLLEYHLKHGKDRDPENCLRIYFFFDEADQIVVVGWLPSHLETSQT